ncbi:MAG: hypothetical protein FWG56_02750 [Desulfovibrionaceae bacterium]|jgi:hypothetical protein|nr:hypothetical protein [Desulfovibrionaceae bacterium]
MLPRRLHRRIARLALAWFALTLCVAAAAPLAQPRAMQLVCSAAGAVKLLVNTGDGPVEASHATLDCALCLLANTPPAHALTALPPAAPSTPGIAAPRLAAPVVAQARAPLPARGPPAFS